MMAHSIGVARVIRIGREQVIALPPELHIDGDFVTLTVNDASSKTLPHQSVHTNASDLASTSVLPPVSPTTFSTHLTASPLLGSERLHGFFAQLTQWRHDCPEALSDTETDPWAEVRCQEVGREMVWGGD